MRVLVPWVWFYAISVCYRGGWVGRPECKLAPAAVYYYKQHRRESTVSAHHLLHSYSLRACALLGRVSHRLRAGGFAAQQQNLTRSAWYDRG